MNRANDQQQNQTVTFATMLVANADPAYYPLLVADAAYSY